MNVSQSVKMSFSKSLSTLKIQKDGIYTIVFILALCAFEAFNYSSTDFALSDLLGSLRFAGIRWATLLTIAVCGLNFAGVVRLFKSRAGKNPPVSIWFLFAAWILAATMNAILTWWGVSLAIQTHLVLSASAVDPGFVIKVVPIFIALMVWMIRILLIGTLTRQGNGGSADAVVQNPDGAATVSRRAFRQAQSQAAHPAQPGRSTPAGLSSTVQAKTSSTKRGYRPEPQYIPMQDEAAYRSMKTTRSS